MSRKLTTVVAFAAAVSFALLGCSSQSGTAEAPEPTEVAQEETVQEEATEEDSQGLLTDEEACELFAELAQVQSEAGQAVWDNPEDYDPQETIEIQVRFMEGVKDVGERAASEEFRDLALKTYESGMVNAEYDRRVQTETPNKTLTQEAADSVNAYSDDLNALFAFCAK